MMILVIQVRPVLEFLLVFVLGITNELVIEIIAPDHGVVIVEQMFADADLHQAHQQIVIVIHAAVQQRLGLIILHLFSPPPKPRRIPP